MSVMTRGIIAQPYSLAMHSDYSRRQFYSHAQVLLAEHDSARKHWENESNNVQALMDEVARLKAEIAGLKTGYEAYEQVVQGLRAENEQLAKTADCWDRLNILNKALGDSFQAERDQIKAENEALRKDAEIGRLVFQFFDRMDDPADCDPLEKSTGEFLRAVSAAMAKAVQP